LALDKSIAFVPMPQVQSVSDTALGAKRCGVSVHGTLGQLCGVGAGNRSVRPLEDEPIGARPAYKWGTASGGKQGPTLLGFTTPGLF
jgi:hypothetical protein